MIGSLATVDVWFNHPHYAQHSPNVNIEQTSISIVCLPIVQFTWAKLKCVSTSRAKFLCNNKLRFCRAPAQKAAMLNAWREKNHIFHFKRNTNGCYDTAQHHEFVEFNCASEWELVWWVEVLLLLAVDDDVDDYYREHCRRCVLHLN